jgi:scyllo-inositol 2-dehydrogenase (NADP+)
MKNILIVGLGVQGTKRKKLIKNKKILTVDLKNKLADYKNIKDVPTDSYDSVFLCVPDSAKYSLIKYCIVNKKNVLIEKPLWLKNVTEFHYLQELANKNKVLCYTAYNHRFEPHFIKMRKVIKENSLGKIYSCRIFYGNGTARLVRNSDWRDSGSGVLRDLAPHLLDIVRIWFGNKRFKFKIVSSNKFENHSLDHVVILCSSKIFRIEIEMTMCMWKNHHTTDIIGSKGSAHISSLCKWGPTNFTLRKRKLPSGIPIEKNKTLITKDPTWKLEHNHFFKLIKKKVKTNFENDIWIFKILKKMEKKLCNH